VSNSKCWEQAGQTIDSPLTYRYFQQLQFSYDMVCAAGEPTKCGTEQSGRQQSSGSDSSIAAANSDRRGRKPAKKRGRQQNLSRNKVIEWLANRVLKYGIEFEFAN